MDKMVIWPAFIDSELSRSQGRRLARRLCVKSPKAEEMLESARSLGFECEIASKAFPKRWYSETKALLVDQKLARPEAIRRIAEETRRRRAE